MSEASSWWVYIVQCNDGSYYTGITTDVERRCKEHNSSSAGAKYTRNRQPVILVYSEPAHDRSEASKREYAIKHLTRTEKELLTQSWKR